jgi:hypothetical protein
MSRRCAVLTVAAAALTARPVLAEISQRGGDQWEAGYDPGKQKRRSDFTAGLAVGPIAFGSASGYPNEIAKIDDPRYKADTGFGGGSAASIWLGVAFRDWFVLGLGTHFYTIQSTSCPVIVTQGNSPAECVAAFGGAFVLHIEAYPFFYQSPVLQNLGVFTEIGAGGRNVQRGTTVIAEGGFVSLVSLGVVYEPLRLGDHLSFGPYVQGSHEFSGTIRADQLIFGFRGVYYGGP